ncbi:MAG: SIMPL domain-containing protein [Acidimicrobiales bacterium]
MPDSDRAAITVIGVGRVVATPDLVLITIGVETAAATPGEAMRAAAINAATLDRVLGDNGIALADRRTARLTVQPALDYQRQAVSHHTATYLFEVTVRDLTAAGAVVDQASADAALGDVLRVQDISMSFADPDEFIAQARGHAVVAARRQAEQLAAAAGVRLGRLRTLSEGLGADPGGGFKSSAAPHRGAVVQPGSAGLTVQVLATFDIGPADGDWSPCLSDEARAPASAS